MSQNTQPKKTRIQEIDALRGLALFGILVVNIFVFHGPYAYYGEFHSQFTGIEATIVSQMIFFCAGKFMFIFAFLFGYGAWMQFQKYDSLELFKQFWLRRMGLLALIGILHILLFSFGDILLPYALLGMTLPFIIHRKTTVLVAWFLLIHLIPIYEFALRQIWDYSTIFMQSNYSLEEYLTTNSSGSFWEIAKMRYNDYFSLLNEKSIIYIPKEWSLFIVGILAAKYDLVKNLKWSKGLIFCLVAILLIFIWHQYSGQIIPLFNHQGSLPRAFLLGMIIISVDFLHGIVYIIGFWLLWRLPYFPEIVDLLRYVGKMSLTNYLMQSLICGVLFSGYAFGLYGSLLPSQLIGIALFIYSFQLVFSYFWLQKNQFGPIEWWWRKNSYQKLKTNK